MMLFLMACGWLLCLTLVDVSVLSSSSDLSLPKLALDGQKTPILTVIAQTILVRIAKDFKFLGYDSTKKKLIRVSKE